MTVDMGISLNEHVLQKNYNKAHSTPQHNTNKSNLYIYYDSGPGRLGNWLFGYASASAIAHFHKRQLICHERLKPLKHLLPNLELNFKKPKDWKDWTRIQETHGFIFNDKFLRLPAEVNVTIGSYFQDVKYFENITTQIFAAYSDFHPLLLERVKTFIEITKQEVGNKLGFDKPITVCVHIRIGDLLWQKYKGRGYKFAKLPAIKFAMKTMKKKFKQVIFIVASEEQNWYRKQFHQANVVMSNMTSYLDDFVLMQSCDHMIMTVGTFGWWAAWMTSHRGGDVMYYGDPFTVGSSMYQYFNKHSHYPGHWLAYGDNSVTKNMI